MSAMQNEPLKIYGQYGAYFPVAVLVVKSLSNGKAVVEHEDGHEQVIDISEVRDARPASGSPIGLYWNERDAS
jgi:hypothetical protein